jgi:hypothetical protein
VVTLESFPVQINVLARGELPNGCTTIDEVISQLVESEFRVVITTLHQPDLACTQAVVPFEETIPLDVSGLAAGNYTVSVNGIGGSFTLDVDNAGGEGTTTPGATADAGEISGRVWHDLCAVTGSEADEEGETPEGCVVAADTSLYLANGSFEENEPGIQGVTISLFTGTCAATAPEDALTATTDGEGVYNFTGLIPGPYCVLLDTGSEENTLALEEGIITSPAADENGSSSVAVELDGITGQSAIDFGYDFRFLPLGEVDLSTCTNSSEFVQDLSIPDGTVFGPGNQFTASWRLRNNGTCPWGEGYGLTFVGGEQLGGATTVPLPEVVAPGQTVDASVDLIAPEQPGTYRSNWQVSDANGQPFGINGVIEDAFWVQIIVEEGAEAPATPQPNSAVVGGVVWEDICFINTGGSASAGCVETAEGSGIYRGDGSFGSNELPIAGIMVALAEGACPENGVIAPGDELTTAITDQEGLYRFTGLSAGVYCIAIDALNDENVDLLIPGNWTYPAPGTGRLGVRLADAEERLTVDFGWDFQE